MEKIEYKYLIGFEGQYSSIILNSFSINEDYVLLNNIIISRVDIKYFSINEQGSFLIKFLEGKNKYFGLRNNCPTPMILVRDEGKINHIFLKKIKSHYIYNKRKTIIDSL